MGYIQVRTQPVATAGVDFPCDVYIVGGSPGDVVTIRLAQTSGSRPLYSRRVDVVVAADGGGFHTFIVTLHGPNTEARLVADDIVSAIPLASGDAHVSVAP
jgi:hypothetical protein